MVQVLIAGIGKGFLAKIGEMIFKNLKFNGLKNYFLYKTKYKDTDIRISAAYLIRIKSSENKYLLVKNSKIPNQFQPVGGVYKYKKSGKIFLDKLKFRDDDVYNVTDESKKDLRIRIRGKYVSKFLKWFKKGKERECTTYREFKEELLDTGILSGDIFKEENVEMRYITREICDLKYSNHFQCEEILIRDIYEFEPTERQQDDIDSLEEETAQYRFFTYDEIKRLGKVSRNKEYRVGEHTLAILEGEI